MKKERLFLLDGMALTYRAYFSFINRPLINSKGENTSAIYGFITTLIKILNEEKPDHIAVVFDTPQPTFRHEMYTPYKATRQKMPDDMIPQIDKLKETVNAFNVPSLEMDGYEADDIMGTLAKKAEKEGIQTFLVTGDKDFMQLVSPLIYMYRPGKRGDDWEIIGVDGVVKRYGVKPKNIIDLLGLIGDTSDNIPGVAGIGEKTAIPLVRQFGSIETIYEKIDKIDKISLRQKLIEHKKEAFLSKQLVTINTEVPIPVDLHQLVAKPPNKEKLLKIFTELEFRSLINKIKSIGKNEKIKNEISESKDEVIDITTDKHSYHVIDNEKIFQSFYKIISESKFFIFDTETTSTNPLEAELVGISFSFNPGEAWYLPVSYTRNSFDTEKGVVNSKDGDLFSSAKQISLMGKNLKFKGFPLNYITEHLSKIFSNPDIKKGGQNIKYDILVLAMHGIEVKGIIFDTMVANYILRPEGQHSLDKQALDYLKYKTVPYSALFENMAGKYDIREVPLEKLANYSCEDADITFRIYEIQKEKIVKENLVNLCNNVEFPLISVLARMEYTGVKLDVDYLSDLSKEIERILQNLTKDIHNFAGEEFNINSTQQLGKILFEKLKLSAGRKTKTGFSTDVGVLETLRNEHPIIEKILEYRQLQKLKSTYIDALPSLINPATGRVHTSFNQTVTSTGRLSSSNPNLQNIPIRTELGSRIRKAFIPGNNNLILSADYSQIELRIVAHISQDEGLSEAFRNDEDIHATTASKIFGVNIKDVTKDMRRKAKEVNFGIMYGIGPYGLSSRLEISQQEAKEIITTYFKRFPKVNQYIFDTIATARKMGYVSTLLGRRRYLPEINDRNQTVRSNAERQAINMPIQGTAADMIKIAMIKIDKLIEGKKRNMKMLLQVHDELVFEINSHDKDKIKEEIRNEMQNALPLSIPIKVDIGIGKNWLEAH